MLDVFHLLNFALTTKRLERDIEETRMKINIENIFQLASRHVKSIFFLNTTHISIMNKIFAMFIIISHFCWTHEWYSCLMYHTMISSLIDKIREQFLILTNALSTSTSFEMCLMSSKKLIVFIFVYSRAIVARFAMLQLISSKVIEI